jgi:predicted permease
LRLGRAIAPFDVRTPGDAPIVVLSDQGWARLFDRDPQVLGRHLELNGRTLEVVGVVRPEFSGMDDMPLDAWLPMTMYPSLSGQDVFDATQPPRLTLFARLRADVNPEQAEQALLPFTTRIVQAQRNRAIDPAGLRTDLRLRNTPNPLTMEIVAMLLPVFAAFGLVLVAACANVSNVMLARALARHREIGIRLAIGASRGRIVRQLLTEALMVAAMAGVAGLAIATFVLEGGRRALFATLPASMAELISVASLDLDYRVYGFALAIAAATTLIFALLPALQATRLTLTGALRGQPAPGVRKGRLRDLLVAGQVTVSLVLLIAAVTLARNGISIAATDLGLDPRQVFSVNQRGEGSARIPAAAEALATDPRIDALAVTSRNPLFGRFDTMMVRPGAGPDAAIGDALQTTSYVFVSPEYFPILRIPILRGRAFTPAEAQTEARVGLVSGRAAQALWPDQDPIGRTVRIVPASDRPDDSLIGYGDILIVGVVKDVVSGFVYDGTDTALIYLPTSRTGAHAGALLLRGRTGSGLRREDLRQTLAGVDRNLQLFEALPLWEMTELMLYPVRAASWIGSLLGLVALVLSVSGLYGVLMYLLGQRTREIGIRMALGATAIGVVRLVMRQSARVVGIGAAIGLVFTFAVLKLLASVVTLRNVSLLDGWSFAIGVALIAAAATLATWFPARRAARVDPCRTLRADA